MKPCEQCNWPTDERTLNQTFRFYGFEGCGKCRHNENLRQRAIATGRGYKASYERIQRIQTINADKAAAVS